MKLIAEIISIIRSDPFDRKHTLKLRGAWEGMRRADKGHWRVIYLPPDGDLVSVVYIRRRTEKTYRK